MNTTHNTSIRTGFQQLKRLLKAGNKESPDLRELGGTSGAGLERWKNECLPKPEIYGNCFLQTVKVPVVAIPATTCTPRPR
jgi:hypothetical protein